jgi:phage shock protein A
MQKLVDRARSTGRTTEAGSAGAERLIKNALDAIADAEKAIAGDPKDAQSWRTASESLNIANNLLHEVPLTVADAKGANG